MLALGHLMGRWCAAAVAVGDAQVEDMEHDGETSTNQGDVPKDRQSALGSCVKQLCELTACCVESCLFAELYLAQCVALIVFFALRWGGGGRVCLWGGWGGVYVWVGVMCVCVFFCCAVESLLPKYIYACKMVCKLLGPLWLRHAKWALFLFFVSLLLSVVVKGAWTLENFEIMW